MLVLRKFLRMYQMNDSISVHELHPTVFQEQFCSWRVLNNIEFETGQVTFLHIIKKPRNSSSKVYILVAVAIYWETFSWII